MIIFGREMTVTQEIRVENGFNEAEIRCSDPGKWLIQKKYTEVFQGSIQKEWKEELNSVSFQSQN